MRTATARPRKLAAAAVSALLADSWGDRMDPVERVAQHHRDRNGSLRDQPYWWKRACKPCCGGEEVWPPVRLWPDGGAATTWCTRNTAGVRSRRDLFSVTGGTYERPVDNGLASSLRHQRRPRRDVT